MTTILTCCGKELRGTKAEHCPGGRFGGCCETFANTRAGDLHRAGPYTVRYCRPPEEVGLHLDDRGVWRLPPGNNPWAN